MDILTEDMKKELKEKFKALDINDEHFQEKAQAIIDEAIIGNKDKIGETVVQKTAEEALEEEKEGFNELEQLMSEGVLEDIQDTELKDKLEKQATHKIIDEVAEKASLEAAGFLREPNKETTIEDIVEEILKQLEEVVEEKKQEIEKKIQKNEDMLGKVQKREQLRASKVKVGNLHQKTKNYKGDEGKKLNKNVEAAITDLDKQIDALVKATTVDGNELQSDALEEEKQKLTEEKKKLEDMSKFLKEKYTKDHSKEASKVILVDEIKQKMAGIKYGMGPNALIKQCEGLTILRQEYLKKGFSEEELTSIFKGIPLELEELKTSENAEGLAAVGQTNQIRRLYMNLSNKEAPTEDDKKTIQKCKDGFDDRKERIENICEGYEILPLKTEEEYIEELEAMEEDARSEEGMLFNKGKKAKEVASKTRALKVVLAEILRATKTKGIQEAYARVRSALQRNKTIKAKDIPEELVKPEKKDVRKEVKVGETPKPKAGKEGEKGEETKGTEKGTKPKKPDTMGDEEEGDEGYGHDD